MASTCYLGLRPRFPQEKTIFNLAIHPDGAYAATASGPIVEIWEIANGRTVSRLTHASTVFGLAFTPDGARVVTADCTVRIWRIKDARMEAEINSPSWVSNVAVSPDGKLLAAVSDNEVTIWQLGTQRKLFTVKHDNELPGKIFSKGINRLVFSPNSTSFATAADDRTARIWDTNSGRQINKMVQGRGCRLQPQWDSSRYRQQRQDRTGAGGGRRR